MAQLLSVVEIKEKASQLPGWSVEGKRLQIEKKFKNFVEAIAFINQLVEPAERANHHPDISISYNKVIISLITKDSGGLTEKDFALAQVISNLG